MEGQVNRLKTIRGTFKRVNEPSGRKDKAISVICLAVSAISCWNQSNVSLWKACSPRLDLNRGNCARLLKKLLYAVSRSRKACCRDCELASFNQSQPSAFFELRESQCRVVVGQPVFVWVILMGGVVVDPHS